MLGRTFDATRLGVIVERCYDAVILPELWPSVFQDFADATNATGLIGFEFGAHRQRNMFLCSPSLEESLEAYVREGWYDRNPRLVLAARVSTAHSLVSDVDLAPIEDTGVYDYQAWRHDFLHRQRLGWFAGTDFLYSDSATRIGISVERSAKLEPFQTAELAVMQRALAQVRRALALSPAIGDTRARGLLTGLETAGRAAGLLDASGRIMLLNTQAEHLVGTAIQLRDGRLWVNAPDANKRLQRFVASLVRDGARCDDDPIDFVVLRHSDGRPLIVRGSPIAAVGAEIFRRAKAFLTFETIGGSVHPDGAVLSEAFGLTRAETRIALAIADGQDVGDIAIAQGVSIATVRTHLKALFAKTNTGRQAALVALIAGFGQTRPKPDG